MYRIAIVVLSVLLFSCAPGINKILKSTDPAYKLRMAEKYYADNKYNKAQVLYEDIMPFYKTQPEYQDIFYKYAYCLYNLKDYMNAENLFKTFMESFPNSPKAEEVDYMRAFTFFKQSPKPELDQTNTHKAIGMMQVFINTYPESQRAEEAQRIIDICRIKLETKDVKSAKLYYDRELFRAAGVAYTGLVDDFPESEKSDEYKLMSIKSFYKFAELSVFDKKEERYNKVVEGCGEFVDRFPESKLRNEVENYLKLSQKNIKSIHDEQVKTAA